MRRESVDRMSEHLSVFMKLGCNCSGRDSRATTEKSVVALCFAWRALQPSDVVATPRTPRNEILGRQSADLSQETAGQVLKSKGRLQVWMDGVNASGEVAGQEAISVFAESPTNIRRVLAACRSHRCRGDRWLPAVPGRTPAHFRSTQHWPEAQPLACWRCRVAT